MAKLYSKEELAKIYRQANPGFGNETLSDDEVLAKAAKLPGGDKFMARLAPPAPQPSGFQTMKDLAARGYQNLMRAATPAPAAPPTPSVPTITPAAPRPPEPPLSSQIRQAATAAKSMFLPAPPPPARGVPPLLRRPPAAPPLLQRPDYYAPPAKPAPITTVGGAVKSQFKGIAAARPFEAIHPSPEKLQSINEALDVRPWVERKITGPAMKYIAPVGAEIQDAEILPEDQDIIGRTVLETVNELIPMSPMEAAGWVIGPRAIEIGIKGGLLALSKMAPAAALKAVSPMANLGDVEALFTTIKTAAERAAGFRIPDKTWAPIQDDIARALLKRKIGVPLERVQPAEKPRPSAPKAEAAAAAEQPAEAGKIYPFTGMNTVWERPDIPNTRFEILPPGTTGNPGPKWEAGVRVGGVLKQVEKFSTSKKATEWLDSYQPPKQTLKERLEEIRTGLREAAPEEFAPPAAPAAPETTIWNMSTGQLQEKAVAEGMGTPTWKTDEEVIADMTAYPGGEYLRKWAAEGEIFSKGPGHMVPPEIIEKFGLAQTVADIKAGEREPQAEVNKSLLASRGGETPYLDLLKGMGYFSKKKVLNYLGIKTGENWKNREIPEELKWYVRPSGKTGPGEFAQEAARRGIAAENDVNLAIDGLAQDLEIKQALERGEDISAILGRAREPGEYGGVAYLAKKKPAVDIPGQTFIPGSEPQFPAGKIRPPEGVDPDEFIAGFEAEAQTPGLFDALEAAQGAAEGVKKIEKIPSGEAAAEAPALDQPEANFQPIGTDKTFRLWRSTEQIIEKYAKRFGEDRYVPRGGVGVFYPDTKNIFLQAANNVYVAIHEVVHFVDDKTDWFKGIMRTIGTAKNGAPIYDPKTAPIRKLISQFYVETYPGASMDHPLKKRVKEGIAMLIQKAVESPEILRSPTWIPLERAIIDPAGRYHNPIWPELIKDGQAVMARYRAGDAHKKILARITDGKKPEAVETLFSGWDRAQTFWFDAPHPFLKLARLTNTPADESPYEAIHAYKYLGNLMNANLNPSEGILIIKSGNVVKVGEHNLGHLLNLLRSLDKIERFNTWLIARRARAGFQKMETIRQRVIGITGGAYDIENPQTGALQAWLKELKQTAEPEEYEEIIAKLKAELSDYAHAAALAKNDNIGKDVAEERYRTGFNEMPVEQWAKIHDENTQALLDMYFDVGFLTPARYAELKADAAYASFRRDIITLTHEGEAAAKQAGTLSVSSLKARKGSELRFVGPLYGLMENMYEGFRKTLIQNAKNKIYSMAEKNPEALASAFQKLKLIAVPRKGGGFDYPQLRDPNILMARREGKYLPVAVLDKTLLTVIDNTMLDPAVAGAIEKTVTYFSNLFTQGTTGKYPLFAVANITRDALTFHAQTQTKSVPFYGHVKELMQMALNDGTKNGEYIHRYLTITGGRLTLSHMFDRDIPPDEMYARITGELTKFEKMMRGTAALGDIIGAPSRYSEDFMRCLEFVAAKKAGHNDFAAVEMASQVTAPFAHEGTMGSQYGRTTVKAVSYFKAGLQVLHQLLKTHENPKTRARALWTEIALAAAIIGSTYAVRSASKRQKQNLHGTPVGIREGFILYPMPGETAREKGRIGKIAIPENYAVPGNILNMIILELTKEDKFSGGEYFQAATAGLPDQLNPAQGMRMAIAWTPTMMQTWLALYTGKKYYPNLTDITPADLKRLPLEKRYTENTSWAAKKLSAEIGKGLNLDPMEIDYLVEGTLGRTSRFITLRLGTRNFTNPIWTDLYLGATRDMEFYYKLSKTIAEQINYFKEQVKEAGIAQGNRLTVDSDAGVNETIAAAAEAGVRAEGPSKELLHLIQFKGPVEKIAAELRQYRFYSRVKNPSEETKAARDQMRDTILDDINLLRQDYEKKALTNTKR